MRLSVFKSLVSAKHPVPVFTKNVTIFCTYRGAVDAILSSAGLPKIIISANAFVLQGCFIPCETKATAEIIIFGISEEVDHSCRNALK